MTASATAALDLAEQSAFDQTVVQPEENAMDTVGEIETADAPDTSAPLAPAGNVAVVATDALAGGATFFTLNVDLDRFPANAELIGDDPDNDLISSIKAIGGLMEPVSLTNYDPNNNDGIVTPANIISGRRRVKAFRYLLDAARVAGEGDEAEALWSSVPCRITLTESNNASPLLVLLSHSTRRANLATDLAAIEQIMAKGATVKQVAAWARTTTGAIKAVLQLQKLHPRLRYALDHEGWPNTLAQRAARLRTHEAMQPIADLLDKGEKVTLRMIMDLVKAERAKRRGETLPDLSTDPGAEAFDDDDSEPSGEPASKAPKSGKLADALARVAALEAENARLVEESNREINNLQDQIDLYSKYLANEIARRRKEPTPHKDLAVPKSVQEVSMATQAAVMAAATASDTSEDASDSDEAAEFDGQADEQDPDAGDVFAIDTDDDDTGNERDDNVA